jgi:hypothetical protein
MEKIKAHFISLKSKKIKKVNKGWGKGTFKKYLWVEALDLKQRRHCLAAWR